VWIVVVKFRDHIRYLSKDRLTGSPGKAQGFNSKKQAQRAYQEFFRDNAHSMGPCDVLFERTMDRAPAGQG